MLVCKLWNRVCDLLPSCPLVICGSKDQTVTVWDSGARKIRYKLRGHTEEIYACSLSRNGEYIASGSADRTLKIWSVARGRLQYTLKGHSNVVTSCSFSPVDDSRLVSTSTDQTLRVWDLWVCERNLKQCMASGVRSWDIEASISTINAIWGHHFFSPASFELNGQHFEHKVQVVQGLEHHHVVHLETMQQVWSNPCIQIVSAHRGPLRCCAFSPAGDLVAASGDNGCLRLWDATTFNLLREIKCHGGDLQQDFLFLPTRATNHGCSAVTSVAFSKDGGCVITASADRTLKVCDVDSGAVLHVLVGHANVVTCCAVSPNGRWVASGSWDGSVRMWDLETGTMARVLHQGSSAVWSLHFSASGKQLLCGTGEGFITAWNVMTGAKVCALRMYTRSVSCIVNGDIC
ncbi:hypothetical protein CYMTET_41802 [Cymbomonas tetramitiformis]|uniref:Guanine nucleotide-binding protein subunit beta-like protein n=1 Tax=Cymbomonas tetramitiformis TaxID=36881 RepID=A0AAE0C7G6_9CHLO|nr:hypothetical protein CYMTET_41802 [Cymbomonas tetramitiformis]